MRRREFLAGSSGLAAIPAPGPPGTAAKQTAIRGVKGPFRVIDVHDHVLNTAAANLSEDARNYYSSDATIEALIRGMDEAGVDHGFLLTYNAEDLGAEIRTLKVNPIELKPLVNRTYQVNAWQAHRDRFWLFVNHS